MHRMLHCASNFDKGGEHAINTFRTELLNQRPSLIVPTPILEGQQPFDIGLAHFGHPRARYKYLGWFWETNTFLDVWWRNNYHHFTLRLACLRRQRKKKPLNNLSTDVRSNTCATRATTPESVGRRLLIIDSNHQRLPSAPDLAQRSWNSTQPPTKWSEVLPYRGKTVLLHSI